MNTIANFIFQKGEVVQLESQLQVTKPASKEANKQFINYDDLCKLNHHAIKGVFLRK